MAYIFYGEQMARIENKALHVLQQTERNLLEHISTSAQASQEAQVAFDKYVNQELALRVELKSVQDAIAILTEPPAPKKKAKKDA